MSLSRRLLPFVASLFLVASSAVTAQRAQPASQSRAAVRAAIEAKLQTLKAPHNTCGFIAGVTREKDILVASGDRTPLIPASTEKLLTTGALILTVGPDHKINTDLIAQGTVENGVLNGALRIRGEGDTSFGAHEQGDTLEGVRLMVARLKEKGITRIAGPLLVDDSAFDQVFRGQEWPHASPAADYLAEVAALSLDDGLAKVLVSAGSATRPTLSVVPDLGHITLKNNLGFADDKRKPGVGFTRDADSNEITVAGAVTHGDKPVTHEVAIHDPAMFFGRAVAFVLREAGIALDGPVRRAEETERTGGTVLVNYSTPLAAVFPEMLKVSQNQRAEMLFKHLGFATGNGGTFAGSGKAVMQALEKAGIDTAGCVVADGSGLSRQNKTTARVEFDLLQALARRADGVAIREMLAEPAAAGTLKRRMPGLKGRLFAKTGTLNGVSGLSGYVRCRGGAWITFACLMNGSGGDFHASQEALVEALASLDVRE